MMGSGSLLICFHGFGFDSRIFSQLMQRLSLYHQIAIIDLPGFGYTKPMPLSDFFLRIESIFSAEKAILGWSMGGLVAIEYASVFRATVKRLFLVSSAPCLLLKPDWPGISPIVFDRFYHHMLTQKEKALSDFVALHTQQDVHYEADVFPLDTTLKEALHYIKATDLRDVLSHLTLPIHAYFSRLDSIVTLKMFHRFSSYYPKIDVYCAEESAHIPFLSHTIEFDKWLLDRLKRI